MILLDFENQKYTIDELFEITPKNDVLKNEIKLILDSYSSPAQGFKTSYVAEELKKHGFNVLDVYDEEMEDAPDGVVY